MQIFNVFLCRSARHSVFSANFLVNPLIMWGVLLEIFLALVINYTWLGNRLLDAAPIPAALWGLLIAFRLGMLILEELRKGICRRAARQDDLVQMARRE